MNEEKLNNLTNQLRNYQDIYNEVELNGNYNNNNIKHSNNQQPQQHSASSNEYSSSSSSTHSNGKLNGTLARDKLTQQTSNMHIYQSPSQTSVNNNSNNANTSQPGTPNSNHSNNYVTNETPVKANNSSGAYAVSPVSQLLTNKMAPIVTNNNESFDDDDENYDDGCYEDPSAALKCVSLKYQSKALTDSSTTTTDSIKSNKNITSNLPDNTASIIYADSQYDHVDSNLYDQDNNNDCDKDLIIGTALVMYAFEGTVQNAMSIQENESLNVLEKDKGDGWTLVKRLNGEKGYVPTDYIRIVYY